MAQSWWQSLRALDSCSEVMSLISDTILELFDNKGYTIRTPKKGAKLTLYCRSALSFCHGQESWLCSKQEVMFHAVYGIMV